MISVIIPTFNAEGELAASLTALVPATIEGLVREVIIVDGGSGDNSLLVAQEAGAKIFTTKRGRGPQLALGGREAKGPWLLFLHADTVLEPGWEKEVERFMQSHRGKVAAAAFRFALDDQGAAPRFVERMVGLRSRLLKLPYGDQGLLIHKDLYEQTGGFGELPLMEDVDFVRRLGRGRVHLLEARAVTSSRRYRKEGYGRRIARNLYCLAQYFAGIEPQKIARTYDPGGLEGSAGEKRDARS